ncbi:phosphotransferase family protein [Undibacterium pigrum]|uniref:Hygromycin-B 7''-O-kinase n=1 Tax=Undibacterium pigrum TaxID=401470 RepID=A0A318J836_9BURK|nr:phosphotransferase [Undibacterium pigrum]PXX42586.1 hygromycin-B 7''-O-kinase [Undibacterium pigrum]
MTTILNCLPQNLDNPACNDYIANTPLTDWMPVLEHLQQAYDLPAGTWEKIPLGGNALFGLGDEVIVKLAPPNWRRQGDKEILVAPLLENKLSLQTPRLIASGEIDHWVFVIFSRLQGTLLADIWPSLELEQKQAIMVQTGQLFRELRHVEFDAGIAIKVDWPAYIQELIDGCMARHQRRKMPEGLLAQVMPYIEAAGDFASAGEPRFIHMDIHPWNLMAKQEEGQWKLSGLLDFGDAIVGNSDRLEILTPMIFMAQGNPLLLKSLLEAYGEIEDIGTADFQRQLTAYMLIRPDSDITFCMQQVPVSGPRDTWEQVAEQMFPL